MVDLSTAYVHLSDSRLARNGVSGEKWRKNELYTYIQRERKRLCNFVWCNLNGSKRFCISKHVNWTIYFMIICAGGLVCHSFCSIKRQRNWRCFSSTLEYHGNLKAPPPMPNPQKIHKALLRGDHPLMKPYIVYFPWGGAPLNPKGSRAPCEVTSTLDPSWLAGSARAAWCLLWLFKRMPWISLRVISSSDIKSLYKCLRNGYSR